MNDSLDPILQQEEQRRLRTQLIWRLAIAVILVVIVLGILHWLDQDTRPQMKLGPAQDIRIASRPAAPEPLAIASAPQPEAAPASAVAASAVAASAVAASTPVASSAPIVPPPTQTSDAQDNLERFTPKPGQLKHTGPSAAPHAAPAAPRIPYSGRPPAAAEPAAPPATGKAAQRPAAPTVRFPAPISTANGYTVQAGVFLHAANAEKMLMQVQQSGVPAYLETRVQIGPFANRAEAETAIRKLKRAGINPVLKAN